MVGRRDTSQQTGILGRDNEGNWIPLVINEDGKIIVRSENLLWNTETWEFELATQGSPAAAVVNVENFPAVISGTSVPITGEVSNSNDDPTAKYKITNIDSSGDTKYFGYLDRDGNWYIMKLTATQGLYAKGTSNYLSNWDENGKYIGNLEFDYFNNVF